MLTVAVPKRNKLPNIIVLTPKDGLNRENVFCQKRSSGMTRQAVVRLNQKVLENLKNYIED